MLRSGDFRYQHGVRGIVVGFRSKAERLWWCRCLLETSKVLFERRYASAASTVIMALIEWILMCALSCKLGTFFFLEKSFFTQVRVGIAFIVDQK